MTKQRKYIDEFYLLTLKQWLNINQSWHKTSLVEKNFKFFQMKYHAYSQWEIIINCKNALMKYENLFSGTKELITTKLGTKHPWVKETQVVFHKYGPIHQVRGTQVVFLKDGPLNSQKGDNFFSLLLIVMLSSEICADVFIDWNCFSDEQFGPWVPSSS